MDEFDKHDDETPSKSQRKRDMLALQQLGRKLTDADARLLDKCNLPENLRNAIEEYQRLPNKHEARRRQLQFIGRIMRDVDTTDIENALGAREHNVELEKRKFQGLEALRDTLLSGDEQVLTGLIEANPGLEIQHLRQLIRQAKKERELKKAPTASRKLFRYLREHEVEGSNSRPEPDA